MKLIKILLAFIFSITFSIQAWTLGSRRPSTPKPTPPVPPVTTPAFSGDVWYATNVGAVDYLSMLTEPHHWPRARSHVKALQIYSQNLFADNYGDCPSCGQNYFNNLKAHGFFERIKEWNMKLAVETGAVKDWDCTGQQNQNVSRIVLEKVKNAGGKVDYFTLDEPFTAGLKYCSGITAEVIADRVSEYMRVTYENQNKIYGNNNLQIGLIEPYPHFSADQIVWFLQLLNERGSTPVFFHLDFDHWLARNKGMSEAQLANDLRKIQAKCRELNIPFGMIYWGHDGDNNQSFQKDVLELVQKVKRAMGAPDRAIVQSWAQSKSGVSINPPNLTESNSTSLTGILLRLLPML